MRRFRAFPLALMGYIGRQFGASILMIGVILIAIAGLFDLLELFRRSSGKEAVGFDIVIMMGLLKLPELIVQLLPFILLFGGLLGFAKMARTRELVIARAVGVSIWQIIATPLLMGFLIGVVSVTLFNPLAAQLYNRFEVMERNYLENKQSRIEVAETGIWLREVIGDHSHIMNAMNISGMKNTLINVPTEQREQEQALIAQAQQGLNDVVFYVFDQQQIFLYRIDAKKAYLLDGFWQFEEAILNKPGEASEIWASLKEPTEMTLQAIEKNFAAAETLSFWEINDYINRMEAAGFRTASYELKWHALLSSPFMMVAMVLIAALFTTRMGRGTKLYMILAGGFFAGIAIFLFTHIMNALGLSQSIPIIMAGWIPTIATLAIPISLLLHLEDG